jgi:hypothetical protein
MTTRPAPVVPTPQLIALLQEAARQGLNIMDELLRDGREGLRRHAEQTRDLAERDNRARAVMALVQVAPDLRKRYPEMLRLAFERELGDNPLSTIMDSGPSSIRFEQLELMDEQQVQQRISTVRGLQQVLLESEIELSELNALISALMGFAQVRPERNPLRPEIYLEVLQKLLSEQPGDARTHGYWLQILVPLLGKQLRSAYRSVLGQLRQQKIQPARYVINRPVQMVGGGGFTAVPGANAHPSPARSTHAVAASSPVAAVAAKLTVQQLHGLVSGSAQNVEQLAQEVVNLIIANIAGDPRILPPVWQLIYELEPALLALARSDLNFFHDKQHPARLLLEEVVQHSFAYTAEDAPGFDAFLAHLRLTLHEIDPARASSPAPFVAAVERLRRHWSQAEQVREAQQRAAVQALQQAERRNELARQIAEHIRKQPDTVLVPDLVVEFACGPWTQVMAHAQIEGAVGRPDEPDHVALLEDLFWSVRPDQTRQQPGQLVKLIPQLVQGLRQGLARIHYPEDQAQQFFDQLFAIHQGGLDGVSAARTLRAASQPVSATWLAPEEARESGFMDDMGGEPDVQFSATVPAEFPSTEPMGLIDRGSETEPMPMEHGAAAGLALDQLRPGSWVELQVSGQWVRLQLAWVNEQATLCLFSSSNGSNHSMTRRMFDRLVSQGQLRLVSQGGVVERAFDAVAELAMRNSVYMDIQADPPA